MQFVWILLSVFLAILSLGFGGILKILFSGLTLLLGIIALLFVISSKSESLENEAKNIRESNQKWSYPQIKKYRPETHQNPQTVLTGVDVIDNEVKEILNYVLRDYVFNWQCLLTHTNDFSREIRTVAEIVISKLSVKIQEVDWISFCTTRVVNEVASHVRLFKKSRLLVKAGNKDLVSSGIQGESSNLSKMTTVGDLEGHFFDSEAEMNPEICRDLVCTIHQEEINYLQEISEILLFLLLSKEEFVCLPLRSFTRELLVNIVLKPLVDLISDPDFLNQNIVWLYKDYPIKPDQLTLTVRSSESLEELQAMEDFVSKQIAFLRSNDSKSDLDSSLKQQLNSLIYLKSTIDAKYRRLQSGSETDSLGLPNQVDWNQKIGPGLKLFDLPLSVILKNNLALSYFIDYMTSIGCQAYIFFFLNIEGWKASTEQQYQILHSKAPNESEFVTLPSDGMDNMREAAYSIYEEYLSEKASPRLMVEDSAVKRLLFKIRTEPPEPLWFIEVQELIFAKLEHDDRFLESFKKSVGYVKLLAELDLLKDSSIKDQEEDNSSIGDDYSIYDSLSLQSNEDILENPQSDFAGNKDEEDLDSTLTSDIISSDDKIKTHRRGGSGSTLHSVGSRPTHQRNASHGNIVSSFNSNFNLPLESKSPVLKAQIVSYECVKNQGKSYAVYKILVSSSNPKGVNDEERTISRRYSDFYKLHEKITAKYPDLSKLPFPKKKTFGNMVSQVLTHRQKMLHHYLQQLLQYETLQHYVDLLPMLQKFLVEDTAFINEARGNRAEAAAKAVMDVAASTVKSSVKSVSSAVNAVTSVPGLLVDNVMDGISKAFLPNRPLDYSVIPQKQLDFDPNSGLENIPLRIGLLFLDEVFDLRERNQWLRRQIVAILRQILKAMFGDWANRRIVDYFIQLTSPTSISGYIKSFKENIWPDGMPAAEKPVRDENAKMRTRIAAKMTLFSCMPDELRRIIGSETSRSGILLLFEMLQHPVLNKRLAIVLLEGILDNLFAGQNFPGTFQTLHSRSPRVRNELKNSQRTKTDLRR